MVRRSAAPVKSRGIAVGRATAPASADEVAQAVA